MKTRILLALSVLAPIATIARVLPDTSPSQLIADARLVFVGRVESVKPSNLRTTLSYVPYYGTVFQWQIAEVAVIEPFKGVERGQIIRDAMLSVASDSPAQPDYCPPGMLNPQPGDMFLFCLGATPTNGLYAALLAPYDENMSVFVLHRGHPVEADFYRMQYYSGPKPDLLASKSEAKKREYDAMKSWADSRNAQFGLITNLVALDGALQPTGIEKFKAAFAKEIAAPASTNLVYLEWETYTNEHGWRWDVPKGFVVEKKGDGR